MPTPTSIPTPAPGAPVALSGITFALGNVAIGYTSVAATLTITNNQSIPITLGTAHSRSNPSDFAIAAASTCGSSLAAKSQCSYLMTITLIIKGARAATSAISASPDPNNPHQVALNGTGN